MSVERDGKERDMRLLFEILRVLYYRVKWREW